MNKLLEKHSSLLADAFKDYANFDFNKELAEKVVDEYNIMNGVSTDLFIVIYPEILFRN